MIPNIIICDVDVVENEPIICINIEDGNLEINISDDIKLSDLINTYTKLLDTIVSDKSFNERLFEDGLITYNDNTFTIHIACIHRSIIMRYKLELNKEDAITFVSNIIDKLKTFKV